MTIIQLVQKRQRLEAKLPRVVRRCARTGWWDAAREIGDRLNALDVEIREAERKARRAVRRLVR